MKFLRAVEQVAAVDVLNNGGCAPQVNGIA